MGAWTRGACHEEKALGGHCMLANGLAMPPFPAPSCAPFELPAKGLSLGKETPPSPALCKATLVAIESKKPMAVAMPINKAVLDGCWLRSN